MSSGTGESATVLNDRWQGKYVRTEDPTVAPSGYDFDPPEPGKPFGGEGVVKRFYEDDGELWMEVDWGYAWRIFPTTTIMGLDIGGGDK